MAMIRMGKKMLGNSGGFGLNAQSTKLTIKIIHQCRTEVDARSKSKLE